MAEINDAVRARPTEAAARPGRLAPPPLPSPVAGARRRTGRDADASPEPRVQPARPAPAAKSARPLRGAARARARSERARDWRTPPLSLLPEPATIVRHHLSSDALEENARMLETCSTTTACAARSSRSAPARSSPCTNSSPPPGSRPAASSASPTTSPAPMSRARLPLLHHPRPLGHRHRAPQRAARERCCCARSSPPRPTATAPTRCPSPSARTSAASRSSPTSPACRTC